MTEIDRRSFLQMLGIGGMGLVIGGAPIPLFGTSGTPSSLWVPGQEAMVSGHWVVKKKPY